MNLLRRGAESDVAERHVIAAVGLIDPACGVRIYRLARNREGREGRRVIEAPRVLGREERRRVRLGYPVSLPAVVDEISLGRIASEIIFVNRLAVVGEEPELKVIGSDQRFGEGRLLDRVIVQLNEARDCSSGAGVVRVKVELIPGGVGDDEL